MAHDLIGDNKWNTQQIYTRPITARYGAILHLPAVTLHPCMTDIDFGIGTQDTIMLSGLTHQL